MGKWWLYSVTAVTDVAVSVVTDATTYIEELMAEIKWAVLGTGVIANEMAAALAKAGRNIYAVGNRTHSKAVAFAEEA